MSTLQGGLRVCGDWPATTGLAHAGRRLALALLHSGVELSVSTFASGAPRIPELFPEELRDLEGGPPRMINLWTLNVNELHVVTDQEMQPEGTRLYHVATWFWELPVVPEWMQRQIERVSEIWTPTTFVQRAMSRCTDKPVHVVPPVVPIFHASFQSEELRRRLGLPQDRTVFLTSFDFNSTVARKNPHGTVEAFRRAFGHQSDKALLVVKAINLDVNPSFAATLSDAIGDLGGMLIDRNMSSAEYENLFHACDVFVSLHRSEGFGLGLAEAMAIGKPVIGTAYSGSLDFMSADNSCQVGYELREIEAADQLHNPGMEGTYLAGELWADPDLDQASDWMRMLACDQSLRQRIGNAAAESMRSSYSESAVARIALDRLGALAQSLEAGRPRSSQDLG